MVVQLLLRVAEILRAKVKGSEVKFMGVVVESGHVRILRINSLQVDDLNIAVH